MTNQTIEQAVEEFEEKFGSADYGINKFRQFDTDGIFLQDGTDWLTKALQAQRDAGAREVELTHFVWCPQCGDALEQTGTQNKYNCFGCDTDYQLKALTPPTK